MAETLPRVVFITGGTGVLGRALCTAFLENNYTAVIAADVVQTDAFAKLHQLHIKRLYFAECDVTKQDHLEKVIKDCLKKHSQIDVFCANAGIGDESKWRYMIDVNLVGTINTIQLAIKYLSRGGHIVLTSSVASYFGLPPCPVYTATKHAHLGLVRSYSQDKSFNESRLHICAVCPPRMDSPLLAAGMGKHTNKGNEVNVIDPKLVANAVICLIKRCVQGETPLIKLDGSLHHEPELTLENWMHIQKTT